MTPKFSLVVEKETVVMTTYKATCDDKVGIMYYLIGASWRHMALDILVNTGSGNGLLPDGTKPLPELMLTYHR